MPRVTTKGQVTIPKEIRDALGIEPGDEIAFEESDSGYEIRKREPTTADGADPFEKYRGRADSDETMPDRMGRLRGEYPRDVGDGDDVDGDERGVDGDGRDVDGDERGDGDGRDVDGDERGDGESDDDSGADA